MAYQALYRQWRPKDFSHMVSQEAVVDTLRNQIMTNRIAHAYLFCGSRGTGKTSTAKIMAKAVNCENPRNGDPCGECASCLRLMQDESLDIIEIDAASNNGVGEIRDLRETVKYPPQYGRFKVYIIDEVHMLTGSAFNALLKTLEEPPAHIVFILATTEPQKLPATILSRCQRFDFGRIPANKIAGRLQEAVEGAGGEATQESLMMIARAAEGGMRDALNILDMCLGYGKPVDENLVRTVLGTSDRTFLFRFCDALIDENPTEVLLMIDELMKNGKEPIVFAKDVSQHIRTLITARCCGNELEQIMELTTDTCDAYRKQSEKGTISRLMEILELFMHLETEVRYSSSPKIALEAVSLRACLRSQEIDKLVLNERIVELENKLSQISDMVSSGQFISSQEQKDNTKKSQEKKATDSKDSEIQQSEKKSPIAASNDVWKAMMNNIKKEPSIYPFLLKQGTFTGVKGNQYIWVPVSQGIVKTIGTEDKIKIINRYLSEAAGAECVFVIESETNGSGKKQDGEDEYVAALKNTFGQAPVEIRE